MERQLSIIQNAAMPLLQGFITMTIPLTLISFVLGLIVAIVTALARNSKIKPLQAIFFFYVWVFRGTPLLVQLFIVFFGLGRTLSIDPFPAAVLIFSLNTGAYASETVRSALLAIPKGQYESAASLGMSQWQILSRIVAPQAFKIALPPLSNSFISLIKDTSLAASITIVEVFMAAQRIAATTYEPLLLYSMVAVYYLVATTLLTFLQGKLEASMDNY
ncbi:MAG: amino acid ABC transporter permease [Streptococcaceae bacterium]|jgi:cystine transport system permease protein|nr:amino acid ABC transporter permease [Streptococcaceae bacterium]